MNVMVLPPGLRDALLEQMANQDTVVMLTMHADAQWLNFKSRFIGVEVKNGLLLVQRPITDDGRDSALEQGHTVGVSFRKGHKKCVFSSVIAKTGQVTLDNGMVADCLWLSWPDQLQQMQRRLFYRAEVPAHTTVTARFWEGTLHEKAQSEPENGMVFEGKLVDISAGGGRVRVPCGDTYGIQTDTSYVLTFQDESEGSYLQLNTLLRHAQDEPSLGTVSYGFQFVGLEQDPRGRQTLNRLGRMVSKYQRVNLSRRSRR